MKWIALHFLAVMFFVWSGPASATPPAGLDEALSRAGMLEEGDPREVIAVLAPYAGTDHPDVAFQLAMAHMRLAIEGVEPADIATAAIRPALEHAQRAAALGSPHVWSLLWMIHANGWGVPADDEVAIGYLVRGVDAGETGAQLNYSLRLYYGTDGVARDVDRACALFRQLARDQQARPHISHAMGVATTLGECGEPADMARGIAMIQEAADIGEPAAEYDMGRAHEYGWAGPIDMGAALDWYQKAAAQGEARAQWRIGIAWVRGEERAQDGAQAVLWFAQSAASGWPDGMVSLAVMYATGDGVAQDSARAATLYRQAADLGNAHALRSLAGMHVNGEGMPVDPVRARELYREAIEMGAQEVPALRNLIESELRRLDASPSADSRGSSDG